MIDFTKEGRVGDKVKSIEGGEGAILAIVPDAVHSIIVGHDDGNRLYTKEGLADYSNQPSLSFANGSIAIDQGTPPERESEKLYCGLTKKQWQRVIDEEFLVGVSDDSFKHAKEGMRKATLIDYLKIGDINGPPFIEKHNSMWQYAAIPDIVGTRKPHFGGACPTTHDGLIAVKLRNGAWINITLENGRDVWHWRKGDESSTDIMEYIELP